MQLFIRGNNSLFFVLLCYDNVTKCGVGATIGPTGATVLYAVTGEWNDGTATESDTTHGPEPVYVYLPHRGGDLTQRNLHLESDPVGESQQSAASRRLQ